jgi:hypothetical protein
LDGAATDNPADRFAVGPGGFDRNAIERVVRVALGSRGCLLRQAQEQPLPPAADER